MSVETIHLSISGMSCGRCVASAEKALKAVAGVNNVAVNLEPGEAFVTGTASAQTLIAAVSSAGYEARLS